jgi:DMSO/TMAO reductase YedYZ molybdopterin-dependent catalytic subunit
VRQPDTLANRDLAQVREQLELDAVASGNALQLTAPEPLPQVVETFVAPPGVHDRFTSNSNFYIVDAAVRDPRIVERAWRLRIHGAVERETTLSYSDLLSLPAVELDGTLMCISFEYANSLISTTRWTGVRLSDILALAGPRAEVADVALHGAGGYSDSIPLSKALEPTTLAAYGMNGASLSHAHGFPCRAFVPNLYGIKNVKWLQEIELVTHDYRGFWQERAWTDVAEIHAITMIDTPWEETPRDEAGMVWVGGIAFAGSRGVSRVELSIDDGPWLACECEPYVPNLVWQRWRYHWSARPGRHSLTVRAFELDGTPQVATPQPPHPNGLTGLDRIDVRIL